MTTTLEATPELDAFRARYQGWEMTTRIVEPHEIEAWGEGVEGAQTLKEGDTLLLVELRTPGHLHAMWFTNGVIR